MTKTPKPAPAPLPAPASETAPEPAPAAAPATAPEAALAVDGGAAAGEQSRPAVPDAACGEAVRAFLADWNEDRPAEAAAGGYGATARDRWAEQRFDAIPDGDVVASGWIFSFRESRFIGAAALDQVPPVFFPAGHAVPMAATD